MKEIWINMLRVKLWSKVIGHGLSIVVVRNIAWSDMLMMIRNSIVIVKMPLDADCW